MRACVRVCVRVCVCVCACVCVCLSVCVYVCVFDIFLERIMTDALEDHKGTVGNGGRRSTNLRFAGDIDGLAGEEEEMAKLAERLDKASTAYGMEINVENTGLITNNTSGINKEHNVNGQKLETVTGFKYLGSVVTQIDKGSKSEILSRTAQTTAALTRLEPVWNDRIISLSSKIQLVCSPCHIQLPICL